LKSNITLTKANAIIGPDHTLCGILAPGKIDFFLLVFKENF
jgi:hypothetical protein